MWKEREGEYMGPDGGCGGDMTALIGQIKFTVLNLCMGWG